MASPDREMAPRQAPPLREAPPALEGNDLVITTVCTAGWAVALIVVILLRHQIPASSQWWIWTCAAGFGMGLFGLVYVPHLKRSRARIAARRAAARAERVPGDPAGGPGERLEQLVV
jgi:hypothetical protein